MAVAVGCRREQGGGNGVKQRGCNCSIQQQHLLNVFEIHVELRQIPKKKKKSHNLYLLGVICQYLSCTQAVGQCSPGLLHMYLWSDSLLPLCPCMHLILCFCLSGFASTYFCSSSILILNNSVTFHILSYGQVRKGLVM